jgi:hypothetical protein
LVELLALHGLFSQQDVDKIDDSKD